MSSSRQLVVGLFLLGGVVLFAVGLFWIGDRRLMFEDHIVLNAEFRNLNGLQNGAKVRVAGLDAGEVLGITVPPDPESKFRVTFRLVDRFTPVLRSDSVATIQTEGLVGSMILQIDAGTNKGSPVTSGDTIQSREPVIISDMLQQASDTVETLNDAVVDVAKRVDETLVQITAVTAETSQIISGVSDNLEQFVSSGSRVAADVETIVDKIRRSEGTVGMLINDPKLYEKLTGSLDQVEQSARNVRESTEQAKQLLADLKSSGAIDSAAGTLKNIRELTEQANETLAGFRSKNGTSAGVMTDLQATLSNAREATADLAENMEALKRGFFTRGFFRDRGFYDLADLSIQEYRSGEFAPKRERRRIWVPANELFAVGPEGQLQLSEQGKKKLDEVIVPYLVLAPTTPLMIEGYSAAGDENQQFLRSRERASLVRDYLLGKYELKPNYVGLMPLGAEPPEEADGQTREGVAIVYFPEKGQTKASNDLRMVPEQDGFRPLIAGLAPDSGFALGAACQDSERLGGVVDAGVIGRVSHKRYLKGELLLDLPRLWNGNVFVETTTRFRDYPEEDFFGLGPDTSEDSRSNFQRKDIDYTIDVGFRPWRRVRVGASIGYLSGDINPGKDDDFPSVEEIFTPGAVPGLLRPFDYLHSGAFLDYDFDEIQLPPFLGSLALSGQYQARWTYFDDRNLSRASLRRYDIDLRHFVPVRQDRDTVATRVRFSFTDSPPGQEAPFFLLPAVGGGDTLRGFHQYRFRDNNIMALNLEYRHWLNPFLDVVAFADAGKAFARAGQLALGELEGSAGVGTRFKFAGNVFLGFDLGFSREGPRTWIHAGHAF